MSSIRTKNKKSEVNEHLRQIGHFAVINNLDIFKAIGPYFYNQNRKYCLFCCCVYTWTHTEHVDIIHCDCGSTTHDSWDNSSGYLQSYVWPIHKGNIVTAIDTALTLVKKEYLPRKKPKGFNEDVFLAGKAWRQKCRQKDYLSKKQPVFENETH